MLTQRQLKRAIHDKKSTLTTDEIFLSKEYSLLLTQMQAGVTDCKGLSSEIFEEKDGAIAFTDGCKTFINYLSELLEDLSKEEKHEAICGLNLHEGGHILFTDFTLLEKVMANIGNGIIYPHTDNMENVEAFMSDYETIAIVASLYKHLQNSVEDGFIDRAVKKCVPGYAHCLNKVLEIDRKYTLAETYQDYKNKKVDNATLFTNLVLVYARFGITWYDDSTPKDDVITAFEDIIPLIKETVFENIPFRRAKNTWKLFAKLFDFIQRDNQQQQNQQGQGQNSSGNQSNQQSQQGSDNQSGKQEQSGSSQGGQSLKDALKEVANNVINTEKTEHKNAGQPSAENLAKLTEKTKENGNEQQSEKESSSSAPDGTTLEKIAEQVAQSKVCDEQEREIKNNLNSNIKEFLDGEDLHKGISAVVNRGDVNSSSVLKYEKEHGELDMIVKRFIGEFKKEIKDRQTGDTLKGLYSGKRFDATSAHRYDKKVMSRKIAPEDIPDMAVGILIDLSGSMGGRKIETAIKCAYITYKFCTELNIPVFVIGHCVSNHKVHLTSVADESSLDKMDAQRIFSLTTYGCNRDGFALRYCEKKLEKIVADQKMLVVISDGLPNDGGYGSEAGKKDCQQVVKDGIKNGIFTVAAAIDDATQVKQIYKEGVSEKNSAAFLDLSDLKKLPKAFVKIIKAKLE